MLTVLKDLIELIYPPRCPFCRDFLGHDRKVLLGPAEYPICPACYKGLLKIASPLCTLCGRPFQDGIDRDHVCEACLKRRPFFDRAAAPYIYEGLVMEAIHRFKYQGYSGLADALGPLLADFAETWLDPEKGFLMMPVPLHPGRLRARGFNQSLLLARHVASALNCGLDFLSLKRIRYTQPQTGLKSTERRKNIRKAFALEDPKRVEARNVILIDDVATTGNTLNECARVLKRAGAEKVYGLVLARTVIV